MASTVFNPIQQHLLKMFAYDSSEEHLLEIKQVLTEYLARRVKRWINFGMKARLVKRQLSLGVKNICALRTNEACSVRYKLLADVYSSA